VRHTVEYVGGPLDGRCEPLSAARTTVGTIVTHTYLHGGPKIETRYRLGRAEDGRWVYSLLGDDVPDVPETSEITES
jgi:hypothetical protein